MSETPIGNIAIRTTETEQRAFYQLADGTSVFLCAVAREDYESAPLRQKFFDLATELVLRRVRSTRDDVILVHRDPAPPPEADANVGLPCWLCKSEIAQDVRDYLRSSSARDVVRSPSGLPMQCCRVVAV